MVEGSRKNLKILHTSDFHLDSLKDKGCRRFEAVISLAIKNKVDLVIIAGDFFDHSKVGDDLVGFVAGQLQRMALPTVILAGNHDCLASGSIYDRVEFWQDCANVRIFREPDGEIMDLPDLGVSLWGKSINSQDGDFRPLAGLLPPQGNRQWNVAVAHGYYVSTNPPLFRSYHITRREIVSSGWDYMALGHIPVFQCICSEPVKAYYCGSPTMSGTFAIVEFSEEAGIRVTRCLL